MLEGVWLLLTVYLSILLLASAGKTLHNSKHFTKKKPLWNAGCSLFKHSHLRAVPLLIGVEKNPALDNLKNNYCTAFWLKKKKSALLPPRNLPTPLPQKSNGLSLSDVAVLNEKVTFWAFCLWWDNGSRESFPHTLLFPSWASSPPNVAHNDAENMCQALKFCNKAKTLQLFFAPL